MYLLLFDMDGTLVDSQNIIVEGMRRAFAAEGLAAPGRADVLSIIGRSLPEAMRTLHRSGSAAEVERLVQHYKDAFQDLRRLSTSFEALYPGASEAIARLGARDDVVLGIATGKSRRGVQSVIETHGFAGRFVTIQTADDHPSKPHPSMIVTALAETGVAPAHAVMIGDSSYDMEMARAAGIGALGVSWGYQPVAQLSAAGAQAIVHHFDEIDTAIADLLRW